MFYVNFYLQFTDKGSRKIDCPPKIHHRCRKPLIKDRKMFIRVSAMGTRAPSGFGSVTGQVFVQQSLFRYFYFYFIHILSIDKAGCRCKYLGIRMIKNVFKTEFSF